MSSTKRDEENKLLYQKFDKMYDELVKNPVLVGSDEILRVGQVMRKVLDIKMEEIKIKPKDGKDADMQGACSSSAVVELPQQVADKPEMKQVWDSKFAEKFLKAFEILNKNVNVYFAEKLSKTGDEENKPKPN